MKKKNTVPDPARIGRRIRILRRRRHLTQAALAEKIGIRTGPLNTLENGHHLPSVPVLCKLASVLGVEVDHLLGEEASIGTVREAAEPYRRAVRNERPFSAWAGNYDALQARIIRFEPEEGALDAGTVERLDAVVNVYLALEDICEVQKRAGIPLVLKRPSCEVGLERMVARVRALLGVSDAVIFDYLELFENAGLRVVFLPLPATVESITYYDRDNDNAFFFIREGMNVERQLFRLAYELGRVYLHGGGGMVDRRRIGKLDACHAAKRFAAFLLMPEESVLASVRQTGVGPGQWTWEMLMRLKHRFGVSAESFLYRLDELGEISPERKSQLKARIYAYYDAHACAEPDASRRILSPNGRLGDLLLSADLRASSELPELRRILKAARVKA